MSAVGRSLGRLVGVCRADGAYMDGVPTLHSEAVIWCFLIWILSSLLHHDKFILSATLVAFLFFFLHCDGLIGELILFCYVCVCGRGNMAFCRMDI